MSEQIIVTSDPKTGEITIEVVGAKGGGCKQKTKFLEEAFGLGDGAACELKPEYFQEERKTINQQKIGGG